MIDLQFDMLASIVNGTLTNSDTASRRFTGVSIDSRTLKAGELFFAIRGEKSDGHSYIADAVKVGASGVVVDFDPEGVKGVPGDRAIVTVKDTHEALIALAGWYRDKVNPTVVGITGSNGKTTTKEITYQLLSAVTASVYRSPGNLNNLFGLPLSILRMPALTKIAVFEMGISVPGEMTRLTQLAKVDIAVLLNVGPSHLQFLNSVEDVVRAKLEMVTSSNRSVKLIYNADSPVISAEVKKLKLPSVTFGLSEAADITAQNVAIANDGSTDVAIDEHSFRLGLPGRHQVYNLLAAYAIARTLNLSFDSVDTQAIRFSTANWRGQILVQNGVRFLADCYNANPESVKAGLKAFFEIPWTGRRIVVLGDMLELGKDAPRYHQQIGAELGKYTFNQVFLVGPLSNHIHFGAVNNGVEEARCRHFRDAVSLARIAPRLFEPGDFVYLKASRGIGLEVVLDAYAEKEEAA